MRVLAVSSVCGWMAGCGSMVSFETPDELGNDLDPADVDLVDDADGDGVPGGDDCDDDDPSAFPGAADVCGDAFDADCDDEDCLRWLEDFEPGALAPEWILGGTADWAVKTGVAHQGTASVHSGRILDLETSDLSLEIEVPAGGTLSFWHSGSTESGYDFLRFSADGVELGAWSGSWDWTEQTYAMPAGVHELTWSYTKDGSMSAGADSTVVDAVSIEGGAP